MICISINQESRRFALVDMHNAAKQCDLCYGQRSLSRIKHSHRGAAPSANEDSRNNVPG